MAIDNSENDMAIRRPTLLIFTIVIGLGILVNLLLSPLQSFGRELSSNDTLTLPYERIENEIASQHPALYMAYSRRVFEKKSREEGLFWFYVGQLRFKFYLAANSKLDPSGDPALFSSLKHAVGEPINSFAESNPDLWVEMIDKALTWDAKNPDGFTSKDKHEDKYKKIRQGLEELRAYVGEHKQEFLDRDKMPKEWPALRDLKSVRGLEGDYSTKSFFLLATWLFDEELTHEIRFKSDVVRIARESDSSILVTAIAEGQELGRRTIPLKEADEGYSFTTKQEAEDWDLHEGGSTTVITLFRNSEGDLVLKWESTFFGKETRDSPLFEDVSISWERASEIKRPRTDERLQPSRK